MRMILLNVPAVKSVVSRVHRRNARVNSSSASRKAPVVALTLTIMLAVIPESIVVKWSHALNSMKQNARNSATPQMAKRLIMTVHSVERNVVGQTMNWATNMEMSTRTMKMKCNQAQIRERQSND